MVPEESAALAGSGPRRPLGVSIAALFYLVLGTHALIFGGYLATVSPDNAATAGLAGFLQQDASFVRVLALILFGISAFNFVVGAALFQGKWWARWLTAVGAPLPLISFPSPLGGLLFALTMNLYLWGAPSVAHWLRKPLASGAPSQP